MTARRGCSASGGPDFEGRYGFARKPAYVRLRTAAPDARFSEIAVRASELAATDLPGVTRAYIVENEITYLAFPLVPEAISFAALEHVTKNKVSGGAL